MEIMIAHIPKSHWIQSTCPWHSDTSRLEVWHAMLQRFYQWQIGVCTARCRRSKLKILVCFQKSDPEIHFRTFAHGKQLTEVSQTVGHTIASAAGSNAVETRHLNANQVPLEPRERLRGEST